MQPNDTRLRGIVSKQQHISGISTNNLECEKPVDENLRSVGPTRSFVLLGLHGWRITGKR
jgi:hypothetical protein